MRKKCIQCILRERIKVEQERKKAHSIVIIGRNADREKWQNESMTSNWVKHNIYLYWLIYSKKTKEKKLICLINWWYFCLSDFSVACLNFFQSFYSKNWPLNQITRIRWVNFKITDTDDVIFKCRKWDWQSTSQNRHVYDFRQDFSSIISNLLVVRYHLSTIWRIFCVRVTLFSSFFFLANRRNSGSDQNHTISREKPPE